MKDKSDRELLELAAQAAGLPIGRWVDCWMDEPGVQGFYLRGGNWNALADDGDALRLSVKLNIQIEHAGTRRKIDRVQASPKGLGHLADVQMYECDPYAATRRAIVNAAAAIAEQEEAKP